MVDKYLVTENEYLSMTVDPADGHLKATRDNGDPVDFGKVSGDITPDALAARDAAIAAADRAEAVGDTNDTIMAGVAADAGSAFATELSAKFAKRAHVVVGPTGDFPNIGAVLVDYPTGNVDIELQAGTIVEPDTLSPVGVKNVTIRGQGRDATLIQRAGAFIDATANSDAWTLSDFHVTNTVSTNTHDGIKVDYPRRWDISGLSMDGFGGTSIWYRGGIHSRIARNYIIAKDAANVNGYAGVRCDKSAASVVATSFVSEHNYVGSGKQYGFFFDSVNVGSVFNQDVAELCDTGIRFQQCVGELNSPYTEANRVNGIEQHDSNLVLVGKFRDMPVMTWASIGGTDRRPVYVGSTAINPGRAIVFGNSSGPVLDPALAPSIQWGSGTPEGVVTSVVGSVFIRTNGFAGQTLYVKQSGTGNTGWEPLANQTRNSTQFTSAADSINTQAKAAGRQAWDSTTGRPVWASGAPPTSPWKVADGTTAYTPA
jgi:hypothetical protein